MGKSLRREFWCCDTAENCGVEGLEVGVEVAMSRRVGTRNQQRRLVCEHVDPVLQVQRDTAVVCHGMSNGRTFLIACMSAWLRCTR